MKLRELYKEVEKGVKKNERTLFTLASAFGVPLTGVVVWLEKDKIEAAFKDTYARRHSEDPEDRKNGNIELGQRLVKHGGPIVLVGAMTELCIAKSYTCATTLIKEGVEALGTVTSALYDKSEVKFNDEFTKPYDDEDDSPEGIIRNQAAYVSARDMLMKEAVANGYQMAYFAPTGSYLFYRGSLDEHLRTANSTIKSVYSANALKEFPKIYMSEVKEALGVLDCGNIDDGIYWGDRSDSQLTGYPVFHKRKPDTEHGVDSVMWEVYTNDIWTTDKFVF